MSLHRPVGSDHQLARLLQIGVVLEEVVEARAEKHAQMTDELDPAVGELLEHASAESADHRRELEALIATLEAETVPFDEIKRLVEAQYEADEEFDGILYDQLCNEETAYKFYDDLITAIGESEKEFGIDRDRLLSELRAIRAEEEEGAQEVADVMEAQE